MKKFLLFFSVLLGSISIQAQSVKGKVLDLNDEKPLPRASVYLVAKNDTTFKRSIIADTAGKFVFNNLSLRAYDLTISYVGYMPFKQTVTLSAATPEVDLDIIYLDKDASDMEDVTVVTRTPPVTQKGDTVQLSASQYKVNPDANIEDLVKKMPGFTVGRDGSVTAQGEQVRKVTIDGKDFFGDDASAALRNLPASVVDKIQVFDRLSDQAQLTGFDDGNAVKAINIVTRAGMNNGQFGRVYAGYGTDDRYAAGGNMSFFKNNRRISLVAGFNNVNQQNFGAQDLLGVTSSGGGRGGMGGGGRGGMGGGMWGGGGENFQVGQQSGISKTNAFGINYSDKIGKKINLSGSYFFNQSKNINDNIEASDFYNGQFRNDSSYSTSKNMNHRMNMRLEYNIDSFNTLIVTPSVNFQNNESLSLSNSDMIWSGSGDSVNRQNTYRDVARSGYNIRNNVMFRHTFKNNRRRSYSISLNQTFNKNHAETYANGNYRTFDSLRNHTDSLQNQFIDNPTNGYTLGANFNYVEPIGEKSMLQFSYRPSVSKNNADQRTFNFDPISNKHSDFVDSLSNTFENITTTHNGGVTFRKMIDRDNSFSIGAEFQQSRLESDRTYPTISNVNQSFSNFLPNAMLQTAFSSRSKLRVFYRTSTRFPSVTQLQDVLNMSNITSISIGNPRLKQSYNHFLSTRYTFTNTQKGQSLFANIFLNAQQDYITNAVFSPESGKNSIFVDDIEVKSGTQLSKPVNLNGYRSLNSFVTYSQPLNFIKTNISASGGFSYLRTPSMFNNTVYKTENLTYTAGLALSSNISEYVDFNVTYNFNYSDPRSNAPRGNVDNYISQSLGAQLNLLTKSGWFIQNDVSGNNYSGLSGSTFNQNFWLWNASAGKKIFKDRSGELKVSVFDLLKQNQSISREVTGMAIVDSRSMVLQQYFMLTFTYSLKNFGKAPERNENERRGSFGGFGGGNPPPGGMPRP